MIGIHKISPLLYVQSFLLQNRIYNYPEKRFTRDLGSHFWTPPVLSEVSRTFVRLLFGNFVSINNPRIIYRTTNNVISKSSKCSNFSPLILSLRVRVRFHVTIHIFYSWINQPSFISIYNFLQTFTRVFLCFKFRPPRYTWTDPSK